MRAPRILHLAAAAAAGAVLGAAGYAFASGHAPADRPAIITVASDRSLPAAPPAPIHACADRGGAHLLHVQARCHRGQQAITWGTTAAGSPIRAWGSVDLEGGILSGQGAAVRHTGTGVYQVSVTARSCARALNNAPLATVNDIYPPGGLVGASFPDAWVQTHSSDQESFTVYTGEIINGAFTPWDENFDFEDSCR